MNSFSISKEIIELFPGIKIGIMRGSVVNSLHNNELWELITEKTDKLRSLSMDDIREIEGIKAGKKAYRMLGKDPNRYRISAEALLRRISKGNQLYQIHSLVDILNLVSISTGITIGGFDADLVKGNISLGIGREDEEFEAIGRGLLNIHNLPVYRDEIGAIGSPTSDCVRTMMQPDTKNFLMIITGFFGEEGIMNTCEMLKELITKYISGKNIEIRIV